MTDEKRGSLKSKIAETAFHAVIEELQNKARKTIRSIREIAEETADLVMDRASSESAFVRFSLQTRTHYDRFVNEKLSHTEAYIRACEEVIEELCKEAKRNDV